MIGRTIGNYVVKTKIGEGGMGAVYAAEHPRIGRRVAIKVLHPELGKSPEIVARFFTEAKAANEIRNEHIIEILDFGELPDGISYFIMEWLDGKALSTALEQQPKFAIARAMHTCRGIARALAAAHSKGIVHRDLKPDNVYLIKRGDDPDFVKVLDFGIAKLMTNDLSQGFKTQTGAIMGTPYYMSPEQCRGATKDIDHRTDIYALGCILYQMVTGQLPFNAEGLGELLLQHMTRPPTPPTQIDPSIPAEIENAILKALEKEPGKRWASVTEMMNAAGAAMGNLTGPVALPAQTQVAPVADVARPPSIAPTPALKQTTMRGAAAEAVPATQPGKSRRSTFVVGGVVAGVAAIGLIVMLNRKPASQTTTGQTTNVAQPKIETLPPKIETPPKVETPPPAQPKVAHIKIRTAPADAKLTLDSADIPAEGSYPLGEVRHELVVKAAGYRAERLWVVFDGDHDYNVTLKRGKGEHQTAGVTKAATTPPVTATAEKVETPPERPKEPKVEKEKEKEKPGQPAYQGKKGKLITDFPDQ
jgi:serine/threonine-protein kinase